MAFGLGGDLGNITDIAVAAIPGVGQYLGAKDANQTNAQMSEAQMAFQERMSSTAHQREVADLKAAGLNPILSANAGSSTPQGAMATAQNVAEGVSESAQASLMQYLGYQKQLKEMDLLDAQTKKTNVDATVATKGIPEADIKNKFYDYMKKMFQTSPAKQTYDIFNNADMTRIKNPWKKDKK